MEMMVKLNRGDTVKCKQVKDCRDREIIRDFRRLQNVAMSSGDCATFTLKSFQQEIAEETTIGRLVKIFMTFC